MAINRTNVLLRFDGKVAIAEGSTPVYVRGSNGADTVTIEEGVDAILDGSFNRGNDVVNFSGLASSYSVVLLNSSSIQITDANGTKVTIPVGTDGATINFADASRVLVGGSSGITLGTQTVTSTAAAVAAGSGIPAPFAPNDEVGDLPGADPSATNRMVLAPGANVALGEGTDPTRILGSNGADTIDIAEGNVVVLDGSFNRGNDTINFEGLAEDYSIVKSGSSAVVITDANGTSVTIPVGVNGMAINFADASRVLVGSAEGLFLGDQEVTNAVTAIADGDSGVAANYHTLAEVWSDGIPGTPPETEVYWGYTPNGGDEMPYSGIPLADLVAFVTTITGLDLAELGLIDDDGTGPFDNVTNITISNALSLSSEADDDSNATNLVLDFADGSQSIFNVEAQISDDYFAFLNNLLFDADGNSRLFEKVVVEGTEEVYSERLPIVLTPTENNGGTIELERTSNSDDTIVAGHLELLHGAYIDGGAGYNTLEVDAKGVYAQPLQLLNIQEVRVIDLPNFYTDEDGNNVYPDLAEDRGDDASWLDLSRAGQIQHLYVSDQSSESGDLTIVGVRNGATLHLDGAFNGDTTTIQYADVDPAGLTVVLNIGDVNDTINILQNSATLNIVSEGVSNYVQDFFAGGRLTNLNISGTGRFAVDGDLDNSFENDTPIYVDASDNSGGVDLEISGSQNYNVVGSSGDDRFTLTTSDDDGGSINDETVTIDGGEGNNYYQIDGAEVISITNGDGNNNYEVYAGPTGPGLPAVGELSIVTGNGDNKFELTDIADVTLVAGDGDNRVDLTARDSFDYTDPDATPDWVSNVDIDFGNGDNVIYVQAQTDALSPTAGVVDIDVGSGNNEIAAYGRVVDISTTGTGPNTIFATATDTLTINNASSTGSTIALGGDGNDFSQMMNELGGNDANGSPSTPIMHSLNDTVQLNVLAGTNATVLLGLEGYGDGATLTALSGSSISGDNLTLEVRTVVDLRAAELSGVTSVVLDDDNFNIGDSPTANDAMAGGNASVLVLTSDQFKAIGAENMSVDGAVFNTHSFIKIIVTESTSLTELGVDDLPRNIDLILEIQDGVTLTMTAEQLHTRVAQEGVILANDGNTDIASGNVVITGGGINFDPYNTSDTVQTEIGGAIYYGGSLSSDFGSLGNSYNVDVRSTFGGYDRPADPESSVVLTVDTDVTPTVGDLTTFHNALVVTGSNDLTGELSLGQFTGPNPDQFVPFEIDFSELEAEFNAVVDNFEMLAQGGGIYGNSDAGYDAEVFVSIEADDDSANGFDDFPENSLVSQGVSQYTVVQIDGGGGEATIRLCDTTEDLEVIALRGNYNDTLNVLDAAWGLSFELQGGGTAKAEGPTGTSNVGALFASYEWEGADAVVDIIHSVAGDTRPLYSAGVTIDNADSITVNSPEGDAIFQFITGDDVTSLTLNGAGDVTVIGTLPSDLDSIDASGVDGSASISVDDPTDPNPALGDGPLTIVGAEGGTTLSLANVDDGDIASISGAGPITLVVSGPVDLDGTDLENVETVVLAQGASLSLTVAQADEIGPDNFVLAPGATAANLNLAGLGEEPFAIADYDPGITVGLMSVVDQPVVTLNPATDLTGIGGLAVPEGVTLNLTAAQFQQLTGDGTITIINTDGDAGNDAITVNITDLTQADVDGGFDVGDVDVGGGTLSITLAESVVFTDTDAGILVGDNGEPAVVNVGDGLKLTLANVEQVDGMTINGGAGSILEFTDITGFLVNVDASDIGVDVLRLPALLVSGNNVDYMFEGLQERVEKVIYEGIGDVEGRSQTVTIEEGTTLFNDVSFNEYLLDTEVTDITFNLLGGTLITGDIVLSTVQVNEDDIELVPTYLQEVTINSSGTAANTINGDTENVIDGDITPGAYTPAIGLGSRDNQLKSVTINADQALVVTGEIVFSSHGDDPEGTLGNEPDDQITANNDDSAIASLVVNGTADVSLGGLDTSDGDIDGVDIVNNGTGTLSLTLGGNYQEGDALSFTGGATEVTIDNPFVDLSDDDITAVTQLTINDGATVQLSQAQFNALGGANILDGETNGAAALIIDEVGSAPFDATSVDPDISLTVVLEDEDVTLNGDFSGVDQIQVQEGTTLTMTAEQFMQLDGAGTIVVVDTNGDTVTAPIELVITGLTQAQVDAGFSLENVNVAGGSVEITLGEAEVDLGTFDADGVLEPGSDTDITTDDGVQADFTLVDGQTLGLVNVDQADGLTVDGTGTTNLTYRFADFPEVAPPPFGAPAQIDASGYNVTFLNALAASFTDTFIFNEGFSNTEYVIDDLRSGVTLVLYEDPAQLGFLDPTFRTIIIEEGITTPAGLVLNDFDPEDEVRTLDLTLSGNVLVNGSLSVPTRDDKDGDLVQVFFETMVIRSTGPGVNEILGNIDTDDNFLTPGVTSENNLLDIRIIADTDFILGDFGPSIDPRDGDMIFNSVGPNATAMLTINGAGNVTIEGAIDTSDADITSFMLDLTGFTGVLDPDYNANNTETWTITNDNVDAGTAIFQTVSDFAGGDAELSEIDAQDFDGDLTIEDLADIDNGDFTFTSGAGVNNVTLNDGDLDNLGTDNAVGGTGTAADSAGWTFDFTEADVGSEFHLNNGALSGADPGSELNIFLGDNTKLFIDQTMDLSDLDLTITGNPPTLCVADGVTLTLTAAQADGLVIEGESGAASTGVVNIVDLGDEPVDLSGISEDVAGTATLEDDDVTLDPATDLGDFSITLTELSGTSSSLIGQTIRFTTVEQADAREIIVDEVISNNNDSSTNVVWLFDDITAPIDTGDYDPAIGRLWVTPDLINNEGGDVEQLFTTLPSTILRVEFSSLTELNVLLGSNAVDRIVELVHFTDLNDLTFNDVGSSPDEFIRSLNLRFGGEVTIGDVGVGDVIGGANIDPDTVYFNEVVLDSFRAVTRESGTSGETLTSVEYRNDNDGVVEAVSGTQNENAMPDAPNVVGDIFGDDTNDEIDLLAVTIDTHLDRDIDIPIGGATAGIDQNGTNNLRGEAIVIGTITFDSSGVLNPLSSIADASVATLTIDGDNNVTIAAIDTSDTDILTLDIDLTGFTAVLDPVLNVDNTETVNLYNVDVPSDDDGALAIFQEVEGNELSFFDASAYDANLEVTFSQIDSSNEDRDAVPDGVDDPADAGSESDAAFTFTAGSGTSTVTVSQVGANVPTLNADSEWIFDFTDTSGAANGGESQLIIDDTVSFAAGSYLTLIEASTYITGDVDLSEVNLETSNSGDDDMRFYVEAGNSLTITVEQAFQLAADGVEIVGEGTVFLVGDATLLADNYSALQTAVVDASQVTIDNVTDTTFEMTLFGAFDTDGNDIGQTMIGTDFDDLMEFNVGTFGDDSLDYTFDGGLGDDFYRSSASFAYGDFTYVVDAGTDTVYWLNGEDPSQSDADARNDVVQVAAGATLNAFVSQFGGASPNEAGFIATADSFNAGTVNITVDTSELTPGLQDGQLVLIDVSDAGGPNGYNLLGGEDGDDILIGSEFDDIINGGNDEYMGDVNILTGNGGADQFVFITQLADAATLSQNDVAPVPNIDRELLTLTADGADDGDEVININWTVNGVAGGVAVNVGGFADDLGAVRTAVIAAINGAAGVSAVSGTNPGEVIVTPTGGVSGGNLEGLASSVSGTTNTLAGVWSEPVAPGNLEDQAQVTTITVSGTPTDGDVYSLLLNLNGGGGDTSTAVAGPASTAITIAADLAAGLAGAGFTVDYTAGDDFFTITDDIPDNGGFTVELDTDAAFAGSGVSDIALTGALSDLDTADIITDFDSAEGDLVVLGLPAGTFTSTAGALADYADAFAAATAALDGTAMYHFASVTDYDGAAGTGQVNGQEGGGLLFFDANLDGNIDGVLILEDLSVFSSGNIA